MGCAVPLPTGGVHASFRPRGDPADSERGTVTHLYALSGGLFMRVEQKGQSGVAASITLPPESIA